VIVCGALDLIGGPAQSHQIALQMPQAESLILPDRGHMPALEQPRSYRDAVLKWCAAHLAKP
jgi:pimeloyl-ACP methyl ester carboxylesterase